MDVQKLAQTPSAIVFTEPRVTHPKSDSTVAEVAKSLEKRYHLAHIFAKMHLKDVKKVIISEMAKAWKYARPQVQMNEIISKKVKTLWRNYIIRQEHDIHTAAAKRRGNQSFIDTGTYYTAMKVKVE